MKSQDTKAAKINEILSTLASLDVITPEECNLLNIAVIEILVYKKLKH